MEVVKDEIARLFAAKEARRRKLAALPIHEKVRIIVQLQKMVAPLWNARGHRVRVWEIEEASIPRPDADQ